VQIWGFAGRYLRVIRYAGEVLRRLGYRVRIGVQPDPDHYFNYVNDSRHRAQAGFDAWIADFLSPSNFFEPFTCGQFVRNSRANANVSQFCAHAVDAGYHAALAARGTEANARWTALDRQVLAAAPAVPLFTQRSLMLVSDRVGNAQTHQQLGPLLDQFWVR
jgi:ABC-type oligopeptide transport system substrate-binding subunit